MADPQFRFEDHRIDDEGILIRTYYVDFREPANRTPAKSLIKACEKHFAPETRRTILISKPERFRNAGETLISDQGEARAFHRQYTEGCCRPGMPLFATSADKG